MFELPEVTVLSKQINSVLIGKIVHGGSLGNSPHKFVWYNRSEEEFAGLAAGKRVGESWPRGRWLFIPLEPGYVLLLGECGGKMLYHAPGSGMPKKYHLHLRFEDDSFLTVTTQMWGAMELHEAGQEQQRDYVRDMRTTPAEPGFSYEYFRGLVDEVAEGEKRSIKGLLTQDQIIPGLGNAIAQDIMFRAGLHPKRAIRDLSEEQRHTLYDAIRATVEEVTAQGGRYDEFDLFGSPGGYVRLMDRNAAGKPCPECGTSVQKMQYLGGACYLCPSCQPL
jgi:formamidopyrimidine-DNA glycosylase